MDSHSSSILSGYGSFTQTYLKSILSSIDCKDAVVANAWLETLLDVIDLLPSDIIKDEILELAVSKGQNQDIAARVAACKIIGKISTKLDPYILKRDLVGVVQSLCQDVSGEVRGAMCMHLASVARGLGLQTAKNLIVPELVNLCSDEELNVRLSGINTLVQILPLLDKDTRSETIIPLAKKFCKRSLKAQDSTLPVTAHLIGRICHGLNDDMKIAEKDWFLKFYGVLSRLGLNDHANADLNISVPDLVAEVKSSGFLESECRQQAAFNLPAIILFIITPSAQNNRLLYEENRMMSGSENQLSHNENRIMPGFGDRLENDENLLFNQENRPLGGESPILVPERILPVLSSFVSDPSFTVRNTLALSFSKICSLLGPEIGLLKFAFLDLLKCEDVATLCAIVPNFSHILNIFERHKIFHKDDQSNDTFELIEALKTSEKTLSQTSNWRMHFEVLRQFASLALCTSSQLIYEQIVPLMIKTMHEARPIPCRESAGRTLIVYLTTFDNNLYKENVCSILCNEFSKSESCHKRMLFLNVSKIALDLLSTQVFIHFFFRPLLSLHSDRVANIRLKLVLLLPTLKEIVNTSQYGEQLKTLENATGSFLWVEKDRDVLDSMVSVIKELNKIKVHERSVGQSGAKHVMRQTGEKNLEKTENFDSNVDDKRKERDVESNKENEVKSAAAEKQPSPSRSKSELKTQMIPTYIASQRRKSTNFAPAKPPDEKTIDCDMDLNGLSQNSPDKFKFDKENEICMCILSNCKEFSTLNEADEKAEVSVVDKKYDDVKEGFEGQSYKIDGNVNKGENGGSTVLVQLKNVPKTCNKKGHDLSLNQTIELSKKESYFGVGETTQAKTVVNQNCKVSSTKVVEKKVVKHRLPLARLSPFQIFQPRNGLSGEGDKGPPLSPFPLIRTVSLKEFAKRERELAIKKANELKNKAKDVPLRKAELYLQKRNLNKDTNQTKTPGREDAKGSKPAKSAWFSSLRSKWVTSKTTTSSDKPNSSHFQQCLKPEIVSDEKDSSSKSSAEQKTNDDDVILEQQKDAKEDCKVLTEEKTYFAKLTNIEKAKRDRIIRELKNQGVFTWPPPNNRHKQHGLSEKVENNEKLEVKDENVFNNEVIQAIKDAQPSPLLEQEASYADKLDIKDVTSSERLEVRSNSKSPTNRHSKDRTRKLPNPIRENQDLYDTPRPSISYGDLNSLYEDDGYVAKFLVENNRSPKRPSASSEQMSSDKTGYNSDWYNNLVAKFTSSDSRVSLDSIVSKHFERQFPRRISSDEDFYAYHRIAPTVGRRNMRAESFETERKNLQENNFEIDNRRNLGDREFENRGSFDSHEGMAKFEGRYFHDRKDGMLNVRNTRSGNRLGIFKEYSQNPVSYSGNLKARTADGGRYYTHEDLESFKLLEIQRRLAIAAAVEEQLKSRRKREDHFEHETEAYPGFSNFIDRQNFDSSKSFEQDFETRSRVRSYSSDKPDPPHWLFDTAEFRLPSKHTYANEAIEDNTKEMYPIRDLESSWLQQGTSSFKSNIDNSSSYLNFSLQSPYSLTPNILCHDSFSPFSYYNSSFYSISNLDPTTDEFLVDAGVKFDNTEIPGNSRTSSAQFRPGFAGRDSSGYRRVSRGDVKSYNHPQREGSQPKFSNYAKESKSLEKFDFRREKVGLGKYVSRSDVDINHNRPRLSSGSKIPINRSFDETGYEYRQESPVVSLIKTRPRITQRGSRPVSTFSSAYITPKLNRSHRNKSHSQENIYRPSTSDSLPISTSPNHTTRSLPHKSNKAPASPHFKSFQPSSLAKEPSSLPSSLNKSNRVPISHRVTSRSGSSTTPSSRSSSPPLASNGRTSGLNFRPQSNSSGRPRPLSTVVTSQALSSRVRTGSRLPLPTSRK